MSMNELFGMGGGKPKLITPYTSGTGLYEPTVDMARCLVRLQAGGGGGGATGNIGGGGGAFLEFVVRVPIAGLPYVVGAGGSVGVAGGTTSFGKTSASSGASGATGGGGDGIGGFLGLSYGSASTVAVTTTVSNTLTGVAGGGGGNVAQAGCRVGFPVRATTGWSATPASNHTAVANSSGISGGGDSFYGIGGTSGNAPAAGNYGAGGGANAAGLGGYIEIWDFGA